MPVAPPTASSASPALDACRAALWEAVGKGDLRLPMLPEVAHEVLRVSNDPNADIGDLAVLIERDQSLAVHVLRAANSAAFRGDEAITSLQQAVTRLGMRFVADAAFAVSVRNELFRVAEFGAEAAQIWRHALASGAFGREVARVKRLNVEGQYLCGLLHTFGKPTALQMLVRLRDKHQWRLSRTELYGLAEGAHAQLGERMATAWKLPRQVSVVCQWYQRPADAPGFKDETAMTALAHELASWVTTDTVTANSISKNPVIEQLNLYPDDLETLLEKRETVTNIVDALRL